MPRNYKKWTQSDIDFIVQNQNMLDKDVACKLSQITGQTVTPNMIRRQRRKSGLLRKRGRPSKKTSVSV
jgi:hypothetical protein